MTKIILENVQQDFPHYFERHGMPGSTPEERKYQGTFILKAGHPQIAVLDKMILDKCIEYTGAKDKGQKMYDLIKGQPEKCFFQKGENKDLEKHPHFAGTKYITVKNTVQPTVADRLGEDIKDSSHPHYNTMCEGGHTVNVEIDIFAYPKKGTTTTKPGVTASLCGVQFVKRGDVTRGAKVTSKGTFKPLDDGADADDLG
jgi:hypothetical protein